MSKGESKTPSQRQLRVGEELRHALAWILERGEIRDPGLSGQTVTVTEVRISPDLRNATAFVIPLGGGDSTDDVVDALNRAVPFVRRQMAKAVKLKYLPGLNFIADPSFDEARRINDLLTDPMVARDLAPENQDGGENGGQDNGA